MIIDLFKSIYLKIILIFKKTGVIKFKTNSLRVLMYHNISEEDFENFEKQIKYLKKNWNFITPKKFYNLINKRRNIKGRNLLLTFDDGFKSNCVIAKKILNKYKIKAIFFIPVKFIKLKNKKQKIKFIKNNLKLNHINKNMDNMNLEDLRYLKKNGHEIGSHTYSHINLKRIKSIDILNDEIFKKNKDVEKKINFKFKSFAFNFGSIKFISSISLKISLKIYKSVFVAIRGENKINRRLIYRDNADPKEKPYILELYLMGMFDKIYRQQTEELESMLPKE